jgi:hypothetical protein
MKEKTGIAVSVYLPFEIASLLKNESYKRHIKVSQLVTKILTNPIVKLIIKLSR